MINLQCFKFLSLSDHQGSMMNSKERSTKQQGPRGLLVLTEILWTLVGEFLTPQAFCDICLLIFNNRLDIAILGEAYYLVFQCDSHPPCIIMIK